MRRHCQAHNNYTNAFSGDIYGRSPWKTGSVRTIALSQLGIFEGICLQHKIWIHGCGRWRFTARFNHLGLLPPINHDSTIHTLCVFIYVRVGKVAPPTSNSTSWLFVWYNEEGNPKEAVSNETRHGQGSILAYPLLSLLSSAHIWPEIAGKMVKCDFPFVSADCFIKKNQRSSIIFWPTIFSNFSCLTEKLDAH